jgi:hypothetical protein
MSEMNCSRGKRLASAFLLTIVPLSACTHTGEIEATKPEGASYTADTEPRVHRSLIHGLRISMLG